MCYENTGGSASYVSTSPLQTNHLLPGQLFLVVALLFLAKNQDLWPHCARNFLSNNISFIPRAQRFFFSQKKKGATSTARAAPSKNLTGTCSPCARSAFFIQKKERVPPPPRAQRQERTLQELAHHVRAAFFFLSKKLKQKQV